MVRIFSDTNGSGEFVLQTTSLDLESFILDFSEALNDAIMKADDGGLTAMGIMKNAMPIAFKLAGYKADTVQEQRTLVCGTISPNNCEIVASAGR